ncbi:uncharacterized protein BKA55DRAFT_509592 [Fusarium redolens]|uniref:Uncharacterized protein n=1 Tax=Fusarium redolens TaxID=48865 RepID=A0A9P9H9N6_FUSRE|nr:uncharacterized protein BKA55DRAFT_509592 [Fusarium redolens]KAH7253501.1 hypothetical protein BKA55DRAFT_509592 [Fusarium redolens]
MLNAGRTRHMSKSKSMPLPSKQKMGYSKIDYSSQQVSSVSAGETSAARTSLPSYCDFITECPVEEEDPSWSLFEGEWHEDAKKCTLRMKQEYLDQFENPVDPWDKYYNHTAEPESTLESWPKPKSTCSISPPASKSKQTPGWTGEYSSMTEHGASPKVSQWTGQYSDPYEYSVSPTMTRLGKWAKPLVPGGKPDFKWILEYTSE